MSLYSFKKHPELAEDFVIFLTQYSYFSDRIRQIYKTEFKKHFSSPLDYVNAINDIFPFLIVHSYDLTKECGILDYWLEQCIRQADNDGKHSYDERIGAITLLSEIWMSYTDYVDEKPDMTN